MKLSLKPFFFAFAITLGLLIEKSQAATTAFYTVGTDTTTFQMFANETRETHFLLKKDITLTKIGAKIDPLSSSSQFRWRIFESTNTASFGTAIFDQTVSYIDTGLNTYDTSLTIKLDANNFYILSLQAVGVNGNTMSRADEINQSLPLTTADGNFEILDGGANNNFFSNGILPTFSVSTTTIPEPSSILFLGLSCTGLLFRKRSSHF